MTVGLTYFLVVAAGLFGIGCFGLLARRHILTMLISGELMLTAGGIALVAFDRFGWPSRRAGSAMAVLVVVLIAAEVWLAVTCVQVMGRQGQSVRADKLGAPFE